jgi:hypothetical protein
MGSDFAVWFPTRRLTNEQAGELYGQLCEGNTRGVRPSPAVDAFFEELTSSTDPAVWSVPFERSAGHVVMSCIASKSAEVGRLVRKLALQHGLAVYEPDPGVVTYPEKPKGPVKEGTPPMRFW